MRRLARSFGFIVLFRRACFVQIELRCPRCPCRFNAGQEAGAEEIRDRMTVQGAWSGLAEGATFEEMIYAGLVRTGYIGCPECGGVASIQEERRPRRATAGGGRR
jgi:hypothetical protein